MFSPQFSCFTVSARMKIGPGFLLVLVSQSLAGLAQDHVFVEENYPSLVFSPLIFNWHPNKNPQPGPNDTMVNDYYHNGGYLSIDLAGASVAFTFNGSYIAYYSDLHFTHGKMEVELDGARTSITTHSESGPQGTPQVKLFEAHLNPDVQNHVIKLINLENKTMGFDYFLLTPLSIHAKSSKSAVVSMSASDEPAPEATRTPTSTSPGIPLPANIPYSRMVSSLTAQSRIANEPSPSHASAPLETAANPTSNSESPGIPTVTIVIMSFVSSSTLVLIVLVGVCSIRRRRRKRAADDAASLGEATPLSPPLSLASSGFSSTVPFLLQPTLPAAYPAKEVRAMSIPHNDATGDTRAARDPVSSVMLPSYAEAHIAQ
ncbi:hypothetical protein AURDEDRAFT_160408 [Auricularia subglabra TFB-10046 SS5]|nr:hypothetical protein AURDEDRAFT_160408 [Auricularia subglabra TFB-10046 SS5]